VNKNRIRGKLHELRTCHVNLTDMEFKFLNAVLANDKGHIALELKKKLNRAAAFLKKRDKAVAQRTAALEAKILNELGYAAEDTAAEEDAEREMGLDRPWKD
jgi:hypothetical protein